MDEKSLKTSVGQRIIIIVIAILLLGGTFLTYLFVVVGNGGSSSADSEAEISRLTEKYDAKEQEVTEAAKPLSDKYFKDFVGYKSEVKAYNSANANSGGLQTKDLKAGTGRVLEEGDTNYLAYYLGWCADGSIFDSSFNNNDDPTSLKVPLDPSVGLIEGWNQGVVGMKLGGVRQITIPGELAYGDTRDDVCGGKNSPLKFIVLAIEPDEKLTKLNKELDEIYYELYQAYYTSYGSQIGN